MKAIENRQLVIISANLNSELNINVPLQLRFYADEVILKNVVYNTTSDTAVTTINVYCSLTLDPIIASFPNGNFLDANNTFDGSVAYSPDQHLMIGNKFMAGVVNFQFQRPTGLTPYVGNSPLLAAGIAKGIVTLGLEFVKYKNLV